jgi:hypothetical protein
MYHNYYRICNWIIANCGKDVVVQYSKDAMSHRKHHLDPPSFASETNWRVYLLTHEYQRGSKIHCVALCRQRRVLPMGIATYDHLLAEGGTPGHLP